MKNDKKLKAVAYGEVLWDVFGNEKKIGGAPLNLAFRMKSFGCDVGIISCVGEDKNGDDIIENIKAHGIPTTAIIRSKDFSTGVVNVEINDRGSATYDISYPAAWDKIVLNSDAIKLVSDCDILIFGSLICRDSISRNSLEDILKLDCFKVFDVNLRKPHYSYDIVQSLLVQTDFIKFNDEELLEIAQVMNSPHQDLKDNMEFIVQKTGCNSMCVTRGKHGAILMWEGKMYDNDGYNVKVVDTVGAGDSFLAALITSLLKGESPQEALDFSCAVGALVTQSTGANPEISHADVMDLIYSSK